MDTTFSPFALIRNAHVQNFLATSSFRRQRLLNFRPSVKLTERVIDIKTPEGVQLLAKLNTSSQANARLLIIFHGWEGSSESNYVLSLTQAALQQGFDVARVNFRDHGNTHHHNREIFNSSRLNEMADAINSLGQQLDHAQHYLCGFSLGGNFALRIAADPQLLNQPLTAISAICPVISPANTMASLLTGPSTYHRYFASKWRNSLYKKLDYFPDLFKREILGQLKSLDQLNTHFIINHTEFSTVEEYYSTYTLNKALFEKLSCPTLVIASEDDPIIPAKDLSLLNDVSNPMLTQSITKKGSHCAYLERLRGPSWSDNRTLDFFSKNEAVYKVLTPNQWQTLDTTGEFDGSKDDSDSGFIHLSSGAQLESTLQKHFGDQASVVVARIDAQSMGEDLLWEASRSGKLYPHLHNRPLRKTDIISSETRKQH